MPKLLLGSAQFGMRYGAINPDAVPTDSELRQIIELALESKNALNVIDTAAAYGNSQKRLGTLCSSYKEMDFITKFSLPKDGARPTLENVLGNSLSDLSRATIHGLLFHDCSDLLDPRAAELVELLIEAKDSGQVSKIGVSAYTSEDVTNAINILPNLDIVQIPGNYLARDLVESPLLKGLASKGVEIHVRSPFLQGLLLQDPTRTPPNLKFLIPAIKAFNELCTSNEIHPGALALGYLRSQEHITAVVFGGRTKSEVEESIALWNHEHKIAYEPIACDPRYLDPRFW